MPESLGYYFFMTEEKNKAAQHLGRLGALKDGKAHAAKLPKVVRSESARNAATVRWANKRQQEEESL